MRDVRPSRVTLVINHRSKLCPQCYDLAGIENGLSDGNVRAADVRARVDNLLVEDCQQGRQTITRASAVSPRSSTSPPLPRSQSLSRCDGQISRRRARGEAEARAVADGNGDDYVAENGKTYTGGLADLMRHRDAVAGRARAAHIAAALTVPEPAALNAQAVDRLDAADRAADRIATLSTLYPDLTLVELEAVDAAAVPATASFTTPGGVTLVRAAGEWRQVSRVARFDADKTRYINWQQVAADAREMGANFDARTGADGSVVVSLFFSYSDDEALGLHATGSAVRS